MKINCVTNTALPTPDIEFHKLPIREMFYINSVGMDIGVKVEIGRYLCVRTMFTYSVNNPYWLVNRVPSGTRVDIRLEQE